MQVVTRVVTAHVGEDKDNMEIINTTAPISIEELKKYFVNKDTKYIIDYKNSKLKGLKLLTYLSNLDVPCDIQLDITDPEFIDLLKDYLTCPFIVNIELLELATIHLLFHAKDMIKEVPPNALIVSSIMSKFVIDNADIINKWVNILDSLTLYNICLLYTSPSPRDGLLSRMPSSA